MCSRGRAGRTLCFPKPSLAREARRSGGHHGDARVAAGVRIVSTPGHTSGHQSVVLDVKEGIVVLVGQAIYSKAEYEDIQTTATTSGEDPPPDPARYLASAMQLIRLRPRRVYFSHDHAVWDAPTY